MYKIYSFIVISCISSFLVYNANLKEENIIVPLQVEEEIEETSTIIENKIETVEVKEEVKKEEEKELMTLTIPKINFKGKIYNKNSKLNDIDKNIIIMKESSMPDEEEGMIIIGGASGEGIYGDFKELKELEVGGEVISY